MYGFIALAAAVFMAGVGALYQLQAATAPKAGVNGQAEVAAAASAERVGSFGAACIKAAQAAPGAVSPALPVTQGAGGATITPPADANCMTTSAPGGGRYVFASAKMVPGVSFYLRRNTDASAAWYSVPFAGQAVSLTSGQVYAIPASIPTGSVLNWVQLGT